MLLAQTTQPYMIPDIPPGWVAALGALGVILTAISVILGIIIRRQNTSTQNIQALGAGLLANTKAINQSSGPNVPQGVEDAAREIRNDPTKRTDVPQKTDPEPSMGEIVPPRGEK